MRFGLRGLVVCLLSPFVAMACLGGENQCLNPQPECPGAALPGIPFGGTFGAAAGSGNGNEGPSYGGSSATGAGGRGSHVNPPTDDAGASGDFAGAGGDTAVIPGADGGTGGAAGASGAAGSNETP